jgi:N-methylhydantoinase A
MSRRSRLTSEADEAVVIAVDTGGTFTDVVAWWARGVHAVKLASTPADPSAAVLAGVARALEACGAKRADLLIHGSTVATNALLERKVARVVLVTNRGFEDVLAIGRQQRPRLYALAQSRPEPLVPVSRRLGVTGRLGPDGAELEAQDDAELAGLAERVSALRAESLAIVLLHSYASPRHEHRVAASLQRLGLPCSVSCELLPEFREYERTSTTVVNACVAPKMDAYLRRLEEAPSAQRVRVMGSAGGAVPVARARRDAAQTILSGPAGGVAGALHVAARHGIADIVTFDMGGTSTDAAICPGGEALFTRDFAIAGLPVALPMLDIHTVGAGGGSIARLDAGGALRVGPESAGAEPGPACYGRGGTAATVTDANVVLGRLPADGDLPLDAAGAATALGRLAAALGCDAAAAAAGVIAVVNAAMEGALRVISVERGYDPEGFTLVPFGGAAGLHAVALAERLEVRRLLVPPAPGVLSAFGMLVAPVRKEASRSVLLVEPTDAALETVFAELQAAALAEMLEEDADTADVTLRRWIAARYRGQSHELTVPAEAWLDAFHALHERRFGYALRDAAVEAVTLGVDASAPAPNLDEPVLPRAAAPAQAAGIDRVYHDGHFVDALRFRREQLRAGHVVVGPALLLEPTSAFWLSPGWTARVAHDGSLFVER